MTPNGVAFADGEVPHADVWDLIVRRHEEDGPMRDVYSAVADPTRRRMLQLLAETDELSLHEIMAHFEISRTAVSKHLAVLAEAGLVADRRAGRETRYRLNAAPLREIQTWVSTYERFWTDRIEQLRKLLEEDTMSQTDTVAVNLDVEMKSPIDKVWHALTDSATLSKWMLFKTNDFKPVVGHTFQFKDAPYYDGIIDCEVTEVDEPNRLSYTWSTEGVDGQPHTTVVTWTLSAAGDGATRLQLEQTGFRPEAKQEIGGAKAGWKGQLDALQEVLASS